MILSETQTILIVEDDSTMAHIAESRCAAYGYQTSCVSSGEEALVWLHNNHADLMLVDITLPGMDGLECIEQVRRRSGGEIISVVISSCEEGDIINRAFSLGVDDFIHKPVNWQILMQRIGRILRSQQAQDEIALLYSAVVNGNDAIMITDRDNRICYVNPAFSRVTGYSREEVIGRDPHLLSSGAHSPAFYQQMWQQLHETGSWQGVFIDRHKGGDIFEHAVHISAIHPDGDVSQPVSHYISVSIDASEERARERFVREQERMESMITTIGGVAHDFNNILAGITGNSFLIQHNVSNPDKVARYIGKIDALSQHGARLIKQMLAFVQRDPVQIVPLLCNESINGAVSRQQSRSPDVVVRCRLDDTCKILADEEHLGQMLDALLDNGCDAVEGRVDGVVTINMQQHVATGEEGGGTLQAGRVYAKIAVEDNGAGIPADIKRRIFEPFFTTKAVGRGRGLGLSMLYGSIATHNGAVEVITDEGVGSCFTIYLPLVDEGETAACGVSSADGGGEESPRQLLLVDDDDSVREVSAEILRDAGFVVVVAANGSEARQQLSRFGDEIDVVLLDVVMPDINGIDLAREFRQQGAKFPIIFCTGYSCDEVLDQTSGIEGVDVVHKPFSYTELIERVKRA
ncbi:MAG: response regulator [Mariprofundales bacterium]|nr:response regulator [Mariprofundales bacterium]